MGAACWSWKVNASSNQHATPDGALVYIGLAERAEDYAATPKPGAGAEGM